MHIFGFWIPKTNREEKIEHRENEKEVEISELGDEPKVSANLSFDDNDNFLILLDKETDTFPQYLRLQLLFKDEETGFFFYSSCDSLSPESVEVIQRSIYSEFKEFFHSHVHHSGEEDSLLLAFHREVDNNFPALSRSSESELLIDAILHFLKSYEDKFAGKYEEMLSYLLRFRRKYQKGMSKEYL